MRVVSMLTALATVATLPLAAQQVDTSHSGSMSGSAGMGARMGSGAMMGAGMGHRGMMGNGMTGNGMWANGGMMASWMHYGMGMDSSVMLPMMRNMAFMPQHLLAERTSLGLSAAQVRRLKSIEQTMQATHEAMWRQAQPHMRDMANMMSGASPDTAAMKSHFDAASSAMSAAHWAIMNGVVEARGVLTPAERRKVEASAGGWASGSMGRGGTGTSGGGSH
jgi:hypothetical protein